MSSFGGNNSATIAADVSVIQGDLDLIQEDIEDKLSGALIPVAYDQVAVTYNANGTVNTAVYSLAGVQVATATCTYDGSGNLTDVIATFP